MTWGLFFAFVIVAVVFFAGGFYLARRFDKKIESVQEAIKK